MPPTTPFKRLILRAVLRNVSPMVIRLVSVSDRTDLPGLHDVFHAILGWSGDLGYLVRVHGQEFPLNCRIHVGTDVRAGRMARRRFAL